MQEVISKDCSTIIIVDIWNIPIFIPQWVKNNLFPLTEKGLQFDYPEQIIGAFFRFTQDKLCFNIVSFHYGKFR